MGPQPERGTREPDGYLGRIATVGNSASFRRNPGIRRPARQFEGTLLVGGHEMNRVIAATMMTAVLSSAAEPYRELYRPQYHFSPRLNWTNDPCGIVYSNGE